MISAKMMAVALVGMMMAVGAVPLMDAGETDAAGDVQYGLYAMGSNDYGQLGISGVSPVTTPTRIAANIGTIKDVFYSGDTTFILNSEGQLWGMGSNQFGQIGVGTTDNVRTPTRIASDIGAISKVYPAGWTTIIQTTDGKLYGMGSNTYGELGLGTGMSQVLTPTRIAEDAGTVVEVVLAGNSTFILNTEGQLWGTGNNAYGNMGNGTTLNIRNPVRLASDLGTITKVVFTGWSTFIKNENGEVYATGTNNYGQMGWGNTDDVKSFTRVGASLGTIADVYASQYTTFLKTPAGEIYGAGSDHFGALGTGSESEVTTFTRIGASLGTIADVTTTGNETIFITTDNRLYGCGARGGTLGTGTADKVTTPIRIGESIGTISTALLVGDQLFILTEEDALYGTGNNAYGQMGVGTTEDVMTLTRVAEDLEDINRVSGVWNTTMFYAKIPTSTVTITPNDAEYGTVSKASVTDIAPGTTITVSRATITIGTTTITAKASAASDSHTYAFEGWYVGADPLVSGTEISGDMTITAKFTATPKNFTVPIQIDPKTGGSSSQRTIANVPYGSVITFSGQTITVDGKSVTATVGNPDAQYTYAWGSWMYNGEPIVSGTTTITGNAPIVAHMTATLNTYTVTWVYGPEDDRTTETQTYDYGATPTHADPADLDEENQFLHWTPAISPVKKNVTYTAVYGDPATENVSGMIKVLPYVVAIGLIIATAGMINMRNEGQWGKEDYIQMVISIAITVLVFATVLVPICNVLA